MNWPVLFGSSGRCRVIEAVFREISICHPCRNYPHYGNYTSSSNLYVVASSTPSPQGTPGKSPVQRCLPVVGSNGHCSENSASTNATSKVGNDSDVYHTGGRPPTNGFYVSHCWVPGRGLGEEEGERPATSVRESCTPGDIPLESTCNGTIAEGVNPSLGTAEQRAVVRRSSGKGDPERWAAFGPPAAFWRHVPEADSGRCAAEQVRT